MDYSSTLPLEDTLVSMDEFSNQGLHAPNALAHRSTTPLSQASQDSCHNNEAYEKGYLDVIVRQAEKASIHEDTMMPSYKMSSNPRGLALIIEIDEFVNDIHEKRIGSHVDVENLTKLFQQLHFNLDHKKNLSREELRQALQEFARRPEHIKADMMILVVLTHGLDGVIYASNGKIDTEDIYKEFNNTNCPNLKGKPKFFIVQACRGSETDKVWPQLQEEYTSFSKRKRTHRDTVPLPNGGGALNTARPTWEDMIIAYSTIPGYTSVRDHHSGTWFIQALVETFMNHAHERELIDLLRMTSDYLSKFSNHEGEKQTCNVELRHLYKRIYFMPGVKEMTPRMSPRTIRRSLSTPPQSPRARAAFEDDDL